MYSQHMAVSTTKAFATVNLAATTIRRLPTTWLKEPNLISLKYDKRQTGGLYDTIWFIRPNLDQQYSLRWKNVERLTDFS